jgi:hypothetical protein
VRPALTPNALAAKYVAKRNASVPPAPAAGSAAAAAAAAAEGANVFGSAEELEAALQRKGYRLQVALM